MAPGLVVALPALVGAWIAPAGTLATLTGRYAIVVYGVGVLLAAIFHRSRVVLGLIALGFLDTTSIDDLAGDRFAALGTLLVGLFGVVALTRDRGVRSRAGLAQMLTGAATLALATLVLQDPVALAAVAEVRLLPGGFSALLGVGDVTLVVGVVAFLLGALAVYRWRGPVERGLLWSQGLLLIALHPWAGPSQASLLLMGAGLIMSLSLLEQSYFMAYRDELTRLPARRALVRDLAEASGVYTIAMVDVDHFKKFNDTHGHDVGDQVLQLVAARLASSREGNAYRYGGEEFTLVFPNLTREEAVGPADAVRVAVEEATFSIRSWRRPRKPPAGAEKEKKRSRKRAKTLSVTVSIGLADSSVADGNPEAVLKKADQALYRAKDKGRNQVSL